jgi:hypothetical protein
MLAGLVEARGKDCSIAPGDTGRRTGAGAMKKKSKVKSFKLKVKLVLLLKN